MSNKNGSYGKIELMSEGSYKELKITDEEKEQVLELVSASQIMSNAPISELLNLGKDTMFRLSGWTFIRQVDDVR